MAELNEAESTKDAKKTKKEKKMGRWARAPVGYRPKRPTKLQNPGGPNKLKIREKRTSVSADSSE